MAVEGVKIKTIKRKMEKGEAGNSGGGMWNVSVPAHSWWALLEAGEEKSSPAFNHPLNAEFLWDGP